jgi:hypothetical protein
MEQVETPLNNIRAVFVGVGLEVMSTCHALLHQFLAVKTSTESINDEGVNILANLASKPM